MAQQQVRLGRTGKKNQTLMATKKSDKLLGKLGGRGTFPMFGHFFSVFMYILAKLSFLKSLIFTLIGLRLLKSKALD